MSHLVVSKTKTRHNAQDIISTINDNAVIGDWLLSSNPQTVAPFSAISVKDSTGYSVRAAFGIGREKQEFVFHELFVPVHYLTEFVLGYDFFPDMNAFESVFHVEESGAPQRLEGQPAQQAQSHVVEQHPRFVLDLKTCTMYTARHHAQPNGGVTLCITMIEFMHGLGIWETVSMEAASNGITQSGNYVVGTLFGSNSFYRPCLFCGGKTDPVGAKKCSDVCYMEVDKRSSVLSGWGEFRQLLCTSPSGSQDGHVIIRRGPSVANIAANINFTSSNSYGDDFSTTASILRWHFLGSMKILDIHPDASRYISTKLTKQELAAFRNSTHTTMSLTAPNNNPQAVDNPNYLHTGPSANDIGIGPGIDVITLPLTTVGAKRFQCPTCGSRFARRNQAREHSRSVHMAVKPFACKLCHKRFGLAHNLARHTRAVHENQRSKTCHMCGARFNAAYSLSRHIAHVHNKKEREAPLLTDGTSDQQHLLATENHPLFDLTANPPAF